MAQPGHYLEYIWHGMCVALDLLLVMAASLPRSNCDRGSAAFGQNCGRGFAVFAGHMH